MGDPIDLPFQVREKIDCISKTLECPIWYVRVIIHFVLHAWESIAKQPLCLKK